ncbi:MAG: D-tyrosyl-tRNA(Tyr) deacylase [Lachnospiraceae bacterium]|nr:D-tyrosyl-tRNA(Tyr) deacylase [Lachnospiraceae bacterium]MBQ2117276.1 D-tyrosyl-tRNA(Tyr) deacylase [Lachnospiraceae bacterium]MBQ2405499.1 D-tyrosyl-tRNA(Tyr) deacylase [Lachnospiraceae bacterium]MEE0918532.1 D-aminoacyl-tRNA deacylase [Lachnospiraceae bacterium]
MRLLLQRVKEASVKVDGEIIGQIGHGLLVFVGVSDTDDKQIADKMIDKMTKLRIFDDEQGKTNLSAADVNGEFLIISQFTLYADCRKGNRPSFISAGKPEMANELYEYVISEVAKKGFKTEHGSFGADMKVSLLNDGPFTVILDSEEIVKK